MISSCFLVYSEDHYDGFQPYKVFATLDGAAAGIEEHYAYLTSNPAPEAKIYSKVPDVYRENYLAWERAYLEWERNTPCQCDRTKGLKIKELPLD